MGFCISMLHVQVEISLRDIGLRRDREFNVLPRRAAFSPCGSKASRRLHLADPSPEACHHACMLLHLPPWRQSPSTDKNSPLALRLTGSLATTASKSMVPYR